MKTTTSISPEALRDRMVDRIVHAGHARFGLVGKAMRTVPRHAFVPEVSLEEAYADQAVITKRNDGGAALSCASLPLVVGMMLDQLGVIPGARVLEIGAGTGYNAALLAYLVGPDGQVTTVDIDPEVTAQARQALDTTGYGHVKVITRDGVLGAAEYAPYDRLIATVGVWDIPPAWWEQMTPGGRLVAPLRWRGQTRSVALARAGERLVSDSVQLCGFVPMVGQEGEHAGHIAPDGQVTLYWDADQAVDVDALDGVLEQPKEAVWAGVTVGGGESFDGIWLRLTGVEPGTCRLAADDTAIDSDLCFPAVASRSAALVEGNSLAYLSRRRNENSSPGRWELGAVGHGPVGAELAARLSEQILAWNRDRDAEPIITVYPAGTPDDQVDGLAIDKQHVRLVVSY
ncbi:methyltransferase, FxLD system [Streptosporangium longisporum]|uniref:Protein-L-isoaspartate O-methyltransferase n=1 Tax=Streptosporangium longisporum TaxID=46187 RepID=A0ABP6L1J2_9ACTN